MTQFTPLESFGQVPDGWIWGAATAAHQIEGGNTNNDWWRFEHTPGSGTVESSGDACDSFNRWRDDIDVVVNLGLDSYRFSVEWSRIEPAEGEFSAVAIEHYRKQMEYARERGLTTNVTYHHFTTPIWVSDKGGWANPETADLFARFVARTAEVLGEYTDLAATVNEPNMVAMLGYQVGIHAPGIKNDRASWEAAVHTFIDAHKKATAALKAGPGDYPVGWTVAVGETVLHHDNDANSQGFHPEDLDPSDITEDMQAYFWLAEVAFLEAARGDDYIGVQTYSANHIALNGGGIEIPADWRVTQMGWTFTPEALGYTVRRVAEITDVPVMVTENGVASADDNDRIEYYSRSLAALRQAMDDGVDVRGFYAWSLLDNFEWAEGYIPKFGLVEVDPVTFERTPKPSAIWYGKLAQDSRK